MVALTDKRSAEFIEAGPYNMLKSIFVDLKFFVLPLPNSKYSELEHLGRLPLEELEVQVASPGFQILDLNLLVP